MNDATKVKENLEKVIAIDDQLEANEKALAKKKAMEPAVKTVPLASPTQSEPVAEPEGVAAPEPSPTTTAAPEPVAEPEPAPKKKMSPPGPPAPDATPNEKTAAEKALEDTDFAGDDPNAGGNQKKLHSSVGAGGQTGGKMGDGSSNKWSFWC